MKGMRSIWQQIVIYTLIGIYAFALLKPILPVLNDVIAHTFFKMEHLATVHYENGKYHVHVELQKVADKTENKNPADLSVFFDFLSFHVKNETIGVPFCYYTDLSKKPLPFVNFPVVTCPAPPCPPPET